ncbi:ABC protein [Favolaschia claudopus]|uniref:ABC protein n=1 Tax=Favolaschia claudopus TaxID=2862362 RepID=A0AAW0BYD4_9AGAR
MTANIRCPECGFLVREGLEADTESFSFAVRGDTTPEYHRLLNSNDCPEDLQDLDVVESVMSQTESCLTRIESNITRLRARMKQLETQKAYLAEYLAKNKAIVSPLRRLPPELLLEIFSWTLPSILTVRRHGSLNLAESPWALSRVCSRWRAVALSSPFLWSLIAVNYGGLGYEDVSPYPASMLQAQLSRSRAQNLRIHFYGSEQYTPAPQRQLFMLLTSPAQSTRLEELSLSVTCRLLPLLVNLENESFPKLRRLYLQWDAAHSRQRPTAQQLIRSFETAPTLADVGIFHEHYYVPVHLPVRQLTRYSIDGPWDMHRHILRHARFGLVEARVDVRFGVVPPPGPREEEDVIELPALRRLYIKHSAVVLDYLRTPSLEEVALCCPKGEKFEAYATSLQALVARSRCPLRRLCITGNFNAEDTVKVLHAVPSVKELAVIVDSYSARTEAEHLLICLTPPLHDEDVSNDGCEIGSSGTTTPTLVAAAHLTTISLGCDNGTRVAFELFHSMLRARWDSDDCALHTAKLFVDSEVGMSTKKHPHREVLLDLYALRDEGMELDMREGSEAGEAMGGWTFGSLWN